jgi:hypothetical protein
LNEIQDDIPTISARKAKVNLRDADDARSLRATVGVHDPRYISLRTAFGSDDGGLAVFDPKSRFACYLDADAVPVRASFGARVDGFVVGREVCCEQRLAECQTRSCPMARTYVLETDLY